MRREDRLRSLDSSRLLSPLQDALTQWRAAGADPAQVLDIAVLRAAEQSVSIRSEQLEEQRKTFATCSEHVAQWVEMVGMLKASETRIAQLEIPTAEAITSNERKLKDAQNELKRIEAISTSLAAPLERLKAEGRRLLENMPQEHRCPLCDHDYESAESLRRAIDIGSRAVPAALAALATQKTTQAAIAAESALHKSRWDSVIGEIAQLNRAIADARAKLRQAEDTLRGTGAELPSLIQPDFPSRFETAQKPLPMSSRAARASRGDRCAPRCWRFAL